MIRAAVLGFSVLLGCASAQAKEWVVDANASHLGFSGMQSGAPFKGEFAKWQVEISFDPAHPESAHVKAIIDLASAHTGDAQIDASLPQAEWFDLKKAPLATFEADGFIAKGGPNFEAPGRLTLRGVSKSVVLPFTLTTSDSQAVAKGRLTLLRTDFGVGQGAWSSGETVALEVGVDVDLVATAR